MPLSNTLAVVQRLSSYGGTTHYFWPDIFGFARIAMRRVLLLYASRLQVLMSLPGS